MECRFSGDKDFGRCVSPHHYRDDRVQRFIIAILSPRMRGHPLHRGCGQPGPDFPFCEMERREAPGVCETPCDEPCEGSSACRRDGLRVRPARRARHASMGLRSPPRQRCASRRSTARLRGWGAGGVRPSASWSRRGI